MEGNRLEILTKSPGVNNSGENGDVCPVYQVLAQFSLEKISDYLPEKPPGTGLSEGKIEAKTMILRLTKHPKWGII